MHYHVVRIDDEGEHVDSALTFDRQDEAERRAVAMAREIDGPGWSGKRYPGRSWRRQELAVYIDRRVLARRVPRLELSIVRCDVPGREPAPRCGAGGFGRSEPAEGAHRTPAGGDGAPGPARAPAPRQGAGPAGTLRRQ